jgi:hypothetical protein
MATFPNTFIYAQKEAAPVKKRLFCGEDCCYLFPITM